MIVELLLTFSVLTFFGQYNYSSEQLFINHAKNMMLKGQFYWPLQRDGNPISV